jgi:hypothetical protein
LRLLKARDWTAGEIADRFPLAKATLSGHMRPPVFFVSLNRPGLFEASVASLGQQSKHRVARSLL